MRSIIASSWRFSLIVGVVVFCAVGIIFRLWWLQIYIAPKLQIEADSTRRTHRIIHASRGKITDMRGETLADNLVVWDICADPHEILDSDRELIPKIAKILKISEAELSEKLKPKFRVPAEKKEVETAEGKRAGEIPAGDENERAGADARPIRWVILKRDETSKVKDEIDALLPAVVEKQGKKIKRMFKPIYAQRKFVREYPKGQLAAQVIGFVNKAGTPAMGIEATMNKFLAGKNGWIETERDARRRELVHKRFREVPAVDGNTVELTLDATIQSVAEEACAKVAKNFSPESMCVIVSEAGTGKLLALANWPTFNLNEFFDSKKAPISNQKNRALTDVYEPGSVFKIVPVAAALEEGVITPLTIFDCTLEAVPYRGKMLKIPPDSHPIGKATVEDIVRESSNRGSAQIGMLLAERKGEECFYNYVKKFGFGSFTRLISNNGGESAGIVHAPKNWDGLTITRFPMGHAVSVTPLQIHDAMSVIANRGRFMEPLVVNRVLDAHGREIFSYFPRSREQTVSAGTARSVALMLRKVCSPTGTARGADITGFEVAGKTGTTQKLINGKYSNRHHVASFSGFFPASNPKVIITVVIDGAKTRGVAYGGTVAVPVFREIAERTIKWLELKPVESAL